ncbi:MAG: PAC2 family protein [Dehalococcoidia bacterium]|nr:PAC2 family protein [Dehalococcoidia bacterium]
MDIGGFQVDEPIPELTEPHAIVSLRPWVDVGRVGRHALIRLERHLGAQEVGRLSKPGRWYDFTRYRPRIMNVGVERRVTIPNTTVLCAKREDGPDFLFLHLLEPHAYGEDYVDSVLELLKHFDVKRYTQVGGVSDAVPHTRPLLVTGAVPEEHGKRLGIRRSSYQGPTSIVYMVTQEAQRMGIETMNFLVHLPHYAQLDEDYSGVSRLLEIMCDVYSLPSRLVESERGQRQYRQVETAVARNPQAKKLVQQLESNYDEARTRESNEDAAPLAPEVARFLEEMDRRMGEGPDPS